MQVIIPPSACVHTCPQVRTHEKASPHVCSNIEGFRNSWYVLQLLQRLWQALQRPCTQLIFQILQQHARKRLHLLKTLNSSIGQQLIRFAQSSSFSQKALQNYKMLLPSVMNQVWLFSACYLHSTAVALLSTKAVADLSLHDCWHHAHFVVMH